MSPLDYKPMNLKKQISKFRSEILVGEYESAIAIAKSVMAQVEVLMTLRIIKDDRLFSYIQQEYEKCLALKNFIHNRIRTSAQQEVKKWGNKQQHAKWRKKEEPPQNQTHTHQQPLTQKETEKSVGSPIKSLGNQSYMELLQRIEREIMMPIKMPSFFKGHSNEFKLVVTPEQAYASLLTYFIENDFMSIEYEAFEYEFSKAEELNYFYENKITEILVDCKFMPREEIDLSKARRILSEATPVHCVFVSISQNNEYLLA